MTRQLLIFFTICIGFQMISCRLFYSETLKLTSKASAELEELGVVITEMESYFFKHPKPGYERDFIQVLPSEDYPEWKKRSRRRANVLAGVAFVRDSRAESDGL